MSQPECSAPERIARALAYIFVTKQLSESGVMAINPKYVTARIDAVWKDYLFYVNPGYFDLVPAIAAAVSEHQGGLDGLSADLSAAYADHQKTLPPIDWDDF